MPQWSLNPLGLGPEVPRWVARRPCAGRHPGFLGTAWERVGDGISRRPRRPLIHLEVIEMQVRLLRFGSIEVEARKYQNDIVIEGGRVRERKKRPSKPYRDEFGHTPLSADEDLPWGGDRLIIGTGAYGSLPIIPQVLQEARRRGTNLIAIPTKEACRLIASLDRRDVDAVLHVTC